MTDDFRLYHRLVPFFEAHGVAVVVLRPGDPVPPMTRVLLGGPPDDARSRPVLDSLEATLLTVRAALDDRRSVQQGGYQRVVFGIDPGRTIGLACLGDGQVLLVAESRDPREAVERILSWAEGLPARRWEVHVGDGHPGGAELVRIVRERFPQARATLTPEQATTPWSAWSGSRHADAAVLIALRDT